VGVAQPVEHRTVTPMVAGSNPVAHPIFSLSATTGWGMLAGYNHNIHYHDRIFHVQTEDLGTQSALLVTHLFIGGNIIAARKSSYRAELTKPESKTLIMQLMQKQHKEMLRDLVRGAFDQEIQIRSLSASKLDGPAPINVEPGAERPSAIMQAAIEQEVAKEDILEATSLQQAFEARSEAIGKIIFGSEVISDRSFDEVVASFLDEKK
jgi:hypothetical protein